MSKRKVHYEGTLSTLCGLPVVYYMGPTVRVSDRAEEVSCRSCRKVARRQREHWIEVVSKMEGRNG